MPEKVLGEKQIVVLEMGGKGYGVPAERVREIVRLVEISPVPESPAFLAGVIDYRGELAIVVDLASRFGMEAAERTLSSHIIVMEAGDHLVGLLVDKVSDVLNAPSSQVMKPNGDIPVPEELVTGAYEDGDSLVLLLNIDKVLDFNNKEIIKKIRKSAVKK